MRVSSQARTSTSPLFIIQTQNLEYLFLLKPDSIRRQLAWPGRDN
jgi:hypothetical protein